MKQLLRQLASESLVYGLSGIITKFMSIFLVPLYTRILMPADYGILGLVNTTFFFVSIFVVFALDNSAARWFYDSDNEDERKKPIATWFWFQLAIAILVCGFFVALSSPLSKMMFDQNMPQLLIIPAITVVGSILPTIIWNWLRLQRKAWLTVGLSTASALLTILLNLYFTLYLRMGIKGILLASLISNIIYSFLAVALMRRWLSYRYFSGDLLKKMLHYALPLLPTSIAFWVLNSASVYFIALHWAKNEIGLYSIGASVASAVAIVIGAFQMAWSPFAFSIIHKPEAKKVYATVLTLYSVVASFTALAVALFSREVLELLTTPDYYDAFLVSGILAFNAIIYGYAYIGVTGSSIMKKTSPIAVAVLLGSMVTLALYFFLVPQLGKEGAALSTLLGYLVVPVLVFYRSQKLWYIPYNYIPSIIIFGTAGTVFILSTLFAAGATHSVLLKTILLAAWLVVVAATLYVHYKKEIENFMATRKLTLQLSK